LRPVNEGGPNAAYRGQSTEVTMSILFEPRRLGRMLIRAAGLAALLELPSLDGQGVRQMFEDEGLIGPEGAVKQQRL